MSHVRNTIYINTIQSRPAPQCNPNKRNNKRETSAQQMKSSSISCNAFVCFVLSSFFSHFAVCLNDKLLWVYFFCPPHFGIILSCCLLYHSIFAQQQHAPTDDERVNAKWKTVYLRWWIGIIPLSLKWYNLERLDAIHIHLSIKYCIFSLDGCALECACWFCFSDYLGIIHSNSKEKKKKEVSLNSSKENKYSATTAFCRIFNYHQLTWLNLHARFIFLYN